jgi:hypothetical protein
MPCDGSGANGAIAEVPRRFLQPFTGNMPSMRELILDQLSTASAAIGIKEIHQAGT